MSRHHRWATGLTAIALAATLTACDPGDEDPTPTDPTTTVTTTEPPTTDPSTEPTTADHRQQQIDAAEAFVIDAYATAAKVGNDGFENWEEILFPYYAGAPELWANVRRAYEQAAAAGEHTTGAVEIVSITATDWAEDPEGNGYDRVDFQLCVDPRQVVAFDADGKEIPGRTPVDHPYPVSVAVLGQPDSELGWSYLESEPDIDSEC